VFIFTLPLKFILRRVLLPNQVSLRENEYWDILFGQFARRDGSWTRETFTGFQREAGFSSEGTQDEFDECCKRVFGREMTIFNRAQVHFT